MKPQVTFNNIDTDSIENNSHLSESEKLRICFKASLVNSLGKDRCDYHKGLNIIKTTDGEKPYVIVICYLDKGVVDSDRNY